MAYGPVCQMHPTFEATDLFRGCQAAAKGVPVTKRNASYAIVYGTLKSFKKMEGLVQPLEHTVALSKPKISIRKTGQKDILSRSIMKW